MVFTDIHFDNLNFSEIVLWDSIFNWTQIDKLTLKNATLNDCIFNWVIFPELSRLEKIKNEKWIIDWRKMKDNYRQLKFVMDKNWNYTEANKFFWHEMFCYSNTLGWREDLNEKLILYFQEIISDYWNDWIRPLFWILILANIPILSNSYHNNWYLQLSSFNDFLIKLLYIRDYFNLLVQNITPFAEIIRGEKITLLKFIYNLAIIFLIYHFTIALKRTTKR